MAEFNLKDTLNKTIRKFPYLGSTISGINYKVISDKKNSITCYTDAKSIVVNSEFMETLPEGEQTFVFAHECLHIALEHIKRGIGKDLRLWNLAADAVTNALLVHAGLPMPEGAVNYPDALKHDAEEIYDSIKKEVDKRDKQNGKGNQNGQQGNNENSGDQNTSSQGNFGESSGQWQESISKMVEQLSNEQTEGQQQNSNGAKGGGKSATQQGKNQNGSESQGEDNSNGVGDNNSQGGKGQWKDDHSKWQEAMTEMIEQQSKDKNKENKQKGKNNKSKSGAKSARQQMQNQEQNEDQNQTDSKSNKTTEDEKEFDSTQSDKGKNEDESANESSSPKISEKEIVKKNDQMKQELASKIMENLGSKSRGSGGGGILCSVGEVGFPQKPITSWRKLLRSYMEKEDERWGHRFSDRGNGFASRLEDYEPEDMVEVQVIVDTSGSVSNKLLICFLKQVKTLLKQEDCQMEVGSFNNDFNGFVTVKKLSDIDNLHFNIGGGTNFDAASSAFTKRKDVSKICFTDGEDGGDAGIEEKRRDIIWVCYGNRAFKPDNGKVIYVDEKTIENFIDDDKNM